jgi:hypothetical protein
MRARLKLDPNNKELKWELEDAAFRENVEQGIAWALTVGVLALVMAEDDEDFPLLTGSEPDFASEGAERQTRQRSIPALSVRIGDKYWSYARLEPVSTALGLMIDTANSLKKTIVDGRDPAVELDEVINNTRVILKDKSFLTGISQMIELVNDPSRAKKANFVSNFGASFVPNIIRDGLRVTDPKFRDNKIRIADDASGLDYAIQVAKRTGQKAIPIAALAPEAKVDLWGREVNRFPDGDSTVGGRFGHFMTSVLLPTRAGDVDHVLDVDRMMLNYIENNPEAERGETLPSPARDKIRFRGQDVKLDDFWYNRYATLSGQLALSTVQRKRLDVYNPNRS